MASEFKRVALENIISVDATKYKFSRYNICMQEGNKEIFIFNTKSGGSCVISLPFKINTKTIDNFLNLGFLVEKNKDELKEVIDRFKTIRNDESIMRLIILPAETCNFRCTYCYESFREIIMENHTKNSIINFIEKNIYKLKILEVSWFGGEPLLALNQILDLTEKCKKLAESFSVNFISDLTTNGFLLTPQYFEKLVNVGIKGYQVTVDGYANIHDRFRKLINGKGTFWKILANLQAIKKINKDFYFVIRTNFDEQTVDELKKWIGLYNNEFGRDARFKLLFRPIFKTGTERDRQLQLCSLQKGALFESELALCLWEMQDFSASYLRDVLLPNPKMIYCYGGLPNCFVIGADRKVWKCTVGLDEKDSIGIIKDGGNVEFNIQKLNEWNKYTEEWLYDEKCLMCLRLPLCMGGCILSRKNGKRGCYGTFDSLFKAMKIYYKLKGGDRNDYHQKSRRTRYPNRCSR